MTARTIDDVAGGAGLSLPAHVVIEIDEDAKLAGLGLCGYTWPDGLGITLYPDAFESEEQLLRTLVHELVHVRQIRDEGPTTDSVVLAAREREAYAEEEDWWQSYLDQR
jgi:hypothetical protein